MSADDKITTPMQALAELERNPGLELDRSVIQEWMGSEDLECLGALDELVDSVAGVKAIKPPLSTAEVDAFKRVYYRRCLRENMRSDLALSRYEAGWAIVNWIQHLLLRSESSEQALGPWKVWITREYRDGDKDIRECLINATLEHLFDRPQIRRQFEDWQTDPELNEAFTKASEWSSRQ